MTKATLYARVSTMDQEKGISTEDQLERARNYALEQGYEIVVEQKDIISGVFVQARSSFNQIVSLIEVGQVDVIIVDVPDRLGRGDAIAQCRLLTEMRGGRIEYVTSGRDDSTEAGFTLKIADTLVSGLERFHIKRRTMAGKRAWARRGRVIASSVRPYGYKFLNEFHPQSGHKIHCELVPVPDEAEIVVKIFEWCAFEGLSPYKIAKKLTGMVIPTLSDIDKTKRKKLGQYGRWHPDTVRGMVMNETYKGFGGLEKIG